MSATVAGLTTRLRPTPSYTYLEIAGVCTCGGGRGGQSVGELPIPISAHDVGAGCRIGEAEATAHSTREPTAVGSGVGGNASSSHGAQAAARSSSRNA